MNVLINFSYVGLVKNGYADGAQIFWKKWSLDHAALYSHHSRLLSMLFSSEQLMSDEFIATNLFM